MAGPPELDGAAEETIVQEATQLLQRVTLVSGEDVPDVEIIEVVTEVEEWLSNNSTDADSVSVQCILILNEVTVLELSFGPWAHWPG